MLITWFRRRSTSVMHNIAPASSKDQKKPYSCQWNDLQYIHQTCNNSFSTLQRNLLLEQRCTQVSCIIVFNCCQCSYRHTVFTVFQIPYIVFCIGIPFSASRPSSSIVSVHFILLLCDFDICELAHHLTIKSNSNSGGLYMVKPMFELQQGWHALHFQWRTCRKQQEARI